MGILKKNVSHSSLFEGQKLYVAITGRLSQTTPNPDNEKIREKYGHLRYHYEINPSTNDVKFDCILREDLMQTATIAPNYHEQSVRHFQAITLASVPTTQEE